MKDNGNEKDKKDGKKVKIEVDNHPAHVIAGTYIVAEFKTLVGVDASKELEQVINGALVPLADDARIEIKGGEKFVSHVRRGGAAW